MTTEKKAICNPATGEVIAYQKSHSIDEFKKMVQDAGSGREILGNPAGKEACRIHQQDSIYHLSGCG